LSRFTVKHNTTKNYSNYDKIKDYFELCNKKKEQFSPQIQGHLGLPKWLQVIFWAISFEMFCRHPNPYQVGNVNCLLTTNTWTRWNLKFSDIDSWLPHHQPVRGMSTSWSYTCNPLPLSLKTFPWKPLSVISISHLGTLQQMLPFPSQQPRVHWWKDWNLAWWHQHSSDQLLHFTCPQVKRLKFILVTPTL